MHLQPGTLLQGGKYEIGHVLGRGGFGITYLAVQTGLNRKVAVKEFFMRDHCNRDGDTSAVSVPSVGSRDLVNRFKNKFIKEAQMIGEFRNPHIIRIYDVFEENGTAYYVMEYHERSLSDFASWDLNIPQLLYLSERYVRQLCNALAYIHSRRFIHLDIKPHNLLLDSDGNVVLIDFGISKRYDESGEQTSTSPVGVARGYSPLEQYGRKAVSEFSPATDIYSLGATFYKLVTGINPPPAEDVLENGITLPEYVPQNIRKAIIKAMSPVRSARPQNIEAFLDLLDKGAGVDCGLGEIKDEVTEIVTEDVVKESDGISVPESQNMIGDSIHFLGLLFALVAIAISIGLVFIL